jgi:hypothetical protein
MLSAVSIWRSGICEARLKGNRCTLCRRARVETDRLPMAGPIPSSALREGVNRQIEAAFVHALSEGNCYTAVCLKHYELRGSTAEFCPRCRSSCKRWQ